MKNLKSTFTLHFIIVAVTTLILIGLMTLPFLENTRLQLSALIGLSPTQLWLPVVALIFGALFYTYRRAISLVALPLHRLMLEAEHGTQGFAFKTRSKSKEEDSIKHAIESANLKAREARDQADDLDADLNKATLKLETALNRKNELEAKLADFEKHHRDLTQEAETLKASKVALELSLDNERKAKVGAEVEKRTEEIYAQMQKAVSAAAYKAIWIPSLVQELKTPISIIRELSSKLTTSWNQTSISQVNEDLTKIHKQSEAQLELLEEILKRQPVVTSYKPTVAEQAKPSSLSLAKSEPETELPTKIEMTEEIGRIEEPPTAEANALVFEPDAKTAPTATATKPASPYELKRILQNLVQEFSHLAPDTEFSYVLDEDLEIEIEDSNLLNLLHSLTETANSTTKSGSIVIGVELRTRSILFDLACHGTLVPNLNPQALSQAEQYAKALSGSIEVEATSETELHLGFNYPIDSDPSEAEAVFELED